MAPEDAVTTLIDQLRAAFQHQPFEHNGKAAIGVVSMGGIVTSPVVPCTEAELHDLRRAGLLSTTRDGRYTFYAGRTP